MGAETGLFTNTTTRRSFLTGAGKRALALAAIGVVGCSQENGSDQEITETNSLSDKAVNLRRDMRAYEAENTNILTQETVSKIAKYTEDLFGEVFAKKAIPRQILALDYDEAKKYDIEAEKPRGEASIILFSRDATGEIQIDIPLIIFLGKPEIGDPGVNKLSVIRALIEHEYTHTQTNVKLAYKLDGQNSIRKGVETISGRTFEYTHKRGLKWVKGQKSSDARNDIAGYFDEINTQMLTEYFNDPEGNDPIFDQIIKSETYRTGTLAANYRYGAALLKRLYAKLNISISQVENYHFNADPKGLLEKIDAQILARELKLDKAASLILIDISPSSAESITEFEELKNLVEYVEQSTETKVN
ncbi:MAG: hypothetical protein AAB512_03090 [Patescibacteria group bacterium]